MDELSINIVNNYLTLKQALGNELSRAALSFCRIGYLLKRARDEENILKDSGYDNVNAFASAEFGLDKSQVSRFIRINDKFSIGGYSEHLKSEYEQFGYAKLSLMLLLPDEINEELSPEYTKSEIEVIVNEQKEEKAISDLEVMMEDKEDGPDEFIAAIVKELNDEHPDSAIYLNDTMKLAEKMGITVGSADIMEAYIPDGTASYIIRIPGQGRFMVNMKAEGISITNMRDPSEKSPLTWQEFKDVLLEDMKVRDFPEETKKPEKKKPEKVKPAKPKTDIGKTIAAVEKKALDSAVAPVQPEIVKNESESEQNEPEIVKNEGKIAQPQEEIAQPQEEIVQEKPERLSENDVEIVGQSTDNVAQEKFKEDNAAAGEGLTSSQTEMLEWLNLIRRKVVPEDGSRPDWASILEEIKTMERFVKQFTY